MFTSAHVYTRYYPSKPVNQENQGLCGCGCHAGTKPPPAVEARRCKECADELFQSWKTLVDVLMRDD